MKWITVHPNGPDEKGVPVLMFPEGTRQVGPDVAEMFDGPAYVACRTGAPIAIHAADAEPIDVRVGDTVVIRSARARR